MKFSDETLRLYAVTDRRCLCLGSVSLQQAVASALAGGVTCVQYREKDGTTQWKIDEARALAQLCHSFDVPLIVNDSIEVALHAGADGLHLGQDDGSVKEARAQLGSNAIIGCSTHSVEEALKAQDDGADYLGAGALFATSSKGNTTAITPQILSDICAAVTIPVVAIGGISKNNIDQLKGLDIAGVAVISTILGTPCIEEAARELKQMSENLIRG